MALQPAAHQSQAGVDVHGRALDLPRKARSYRTAARGWPPDCQLACPQFNPWRVERESRRWRRGLPGGGRVSSRNRLSGANWRGVGLRKRHQPYSSAGRRFEDQSRIRRESVFPRFGPGGLLNWNVSDPSGKYAQDKLGAGISKRVALTNGRYANEVLGDPSDNG